MSDTVIPDFTEAELPKKRSYAYCSLCRRILRNPLYVQHGIGPVCAEKIGIVIDKPNTLKEGIMQTRIYVVMNKADQSRRLVEASTASQAVRHCVKNQYEAKVAGSKEVASLMREGFQLEVAEVAPKGKKGEAAEAEGEEMADE